MSDTVKGRRDEKESSGGEKAKEKMVTGASLEHLNVKIFSFSISDYYTRPFFNLFAYMKLTQK